jgi:hypothetical protein
MAKIGFHMILSREIHTGKPRQNLAERPYASIMTGYKT